MSTCQSLWPSPLPEAGVCTGRGDTSLAGAPAASGKGLFAQTVLLSKPVKPVEKWSSLQNTGKSRTGNRISFNTDFLGSPSTLVAISTFHNMDFHPQIWDLSDDFLKVIYLTGSNNLILPGNCQLGPKASLDSTADHSWGSLGGRGWSS